MKQIRALRVNSIEPKKSKASQAQQVSLENIDIEHLGRGEVLIRTEFSSLNYKDALAVTGRAPILKKLPLVPGIDVSGEVVESQSAEYSPGQKVLVTGCGLGEDQDGGYAEIVRVPATSVVPIPQGLDTRLAMILGTAGFTAALSLYRMEQNGQRPEQGPVVVTGASGGVGSLATGLLAQRGYEVIAVSGKADMSNFLMELGATKVLSPGELHLGSRPLERARYAGAIDNVGGELLAGLSRHVDLWGNIACVGLAGGSELHCSVMPMILRGVSFLGISSNNTPRPLRLKIWELLASEWKPKNLEGLVSQTLSLEQIPEAAERMLQRQSTGRSLVALQPLPLKAPGPF